MMNERTGMPHPLFHGADNFTSVAGRSQPIVDVQFESVFDPQIGSFRTPGAAKQPSWRGNRLLT